MSRSIRVALALLIVGLGLGIVLHMSPSRAGSTSAPAPARAVSGVAITVADMDRSIDFYATVLFFEKVSDVETSGPLVERLLGVPGLRMRVATMKLGAERIDGTHRVNRRPVNPDFVVGDAVGQRIGADDALIIHDHKVTLTEVQQHALQRVVCHPCG